MIVGTTEAAKILNISTGRLRILLIEGRVEGAYKSGKMWLMPLFNGKPIIQRRKRGPAPRWRNPRKPATTMVHVNTHKIKENQKHNLKQPVITVKKQSNRGEPTLFFSDATHPMSKVEPTTGCINLYGHEVEILGGCRVVYRPDSSKHGAKVWIETLYDVKVICWD